MKASFLNDLLEFEQELGKKRGSLTLFALVLRPEMAAVVSTSAAMNVPPTHFRWDLIVSASWVTGAIDQIHQIAKALESKIDRDSLGALSRIVLLPSNHPVVESIITTVQAEHEIRELDSTMLSRLGFARAIVFTSQNAMDTLRKVAG